MKEKKVNHLQTKCNHGKLVKQSTIFSEAIHGFPEKIEWDKISR